MERMDLLILWLCPRMLFDRRSLMYWDCGLSNYR